MSTAINAAKVSSAPETKSCCAWFENKMTDKTKLALKITGFVASLIILTIAVLATLVTTGVLTETFALHSLGKIGQLASGILLTLSLISTVVFSILLAWVIKERACTKKVEEKATIEVTGKGASAPGDAKKPVEPPKKSSGWWG